MLKRHFIAIAANRHHTPEHDNVDVEEALAAADGSECMETEAYAASERWEEPAPNADRAEGGMQYVDSEWEW